jgi:hypothetical protein
MASDIAAGKITSKIRVGQRQGDHDLAFKRFHSVGVGIGLVIVADEVQKTMHGEMGQMVQENPIFIVTFPGNRLVGKYIFSPPAGAGAGNDSTLVGLSIPRQSRLRARIAASSVSTILTSPSSGASAAAAAAMASRTVCSAKGWASHSGEAI